MYERQDLPLDDLTAVDRDAVERGIGADDLADARRTVVNLFAGSSECEPEVVEVTPSPTRRPTTRPEAPTPPRRRRHVRRRHRHPHADAHPVDVHPPAPDECGR